MNLIITKAKKRYLNECEKALINSNLGKNYFSSKDSARNALNEGLEKQELYVVLSEDRSFIGFFWLIMNGAFHSFPYLHIIVVREEIRGQGYGKRILKEIEDMSFKNYSKLFLVVADFNHQAKKLYEELGYKMVGFIPDLYKSGIGEQIMMKLKD